MLLDIISGKVTDFYSTVQARTEANHMPKLAVISLPRER